MTSSLFARYVGFRTLMFNADKAGGGGGGKKTDLEQLQEAQEENKTLKADLEKARQATKDEEAKVTQAETAKKTAEDQLAQANKDKSAAIERAEKAEAEAKKLQADAKTTDQKAAELAAAHGSLPAKKDGENAANNGGGTDGKALYEQYAKLNGREAAEFWDKHSKALIAYGEQLERKRRETAD